jgi:hypothetical protein
MVRKVVAPATISVRAFIVEELNPKAFCKNIVLSLIATKLRNNYKLIKTFYKKNEREPHLFTRRGSKCEFIYD